MNKNKAILNIVFFFTIILLLSFEKIILSWEINTLYNNSETMRIQQEDLNNINIMLITQYHLEISPAKIEKAAKEDLGMIKKRPNKIILNDE